MNKSLSKILGRGFIFSLLLFSIFVSTSPLAQEASQTIKAQVWADNWFELYVDGKVVKTDSVPITTERSFNAEVFSFEATLPVQLAVRVMDFKEDDSGFEYIGTHRQQIGDGGFIAEFRDASNNLVAATDSSWRCLVIHQAPLNPACGKSASPIDACESNILPEPPGWTTASFDDSAWPNAVVHSASAVRPHGGYSNYFWEDEAQLIWGEDLEVDNTILCRRTLDQS